VVVLLLVLSGLAALVYQLLWIKQLSLVVGVDVYAVTIAVSAFFGGLALGSRVFGRSAESSGRPLRLYAALEVGIAVLGVGITLALAHAAAPFAELESHVGLLAWAVPFLLVGAPATLMGGTMPVLIRAVSPGSGQLGRTGGQLYAANTAGAIAGALLVPFLLVPAFGVTGSALAAAVLNLAAAAGAWALAGGALRTGAASPGARASRVEARPYVGPNFGSATLALRLYAVAGGIALGYEVVWSQAIAQFVSTRVFAFAIVLATYLTGLAIGSALYSRVADRVRDPWGTFGLLVAGAGLVALLAVAGLGTWLMTWQSNLEGAVRAATSSELAAMCARFALAALWFVFAPTLLLGAAFPAALRLAAGPDRIGDDLGRVLALNTAGGIAGTLVTGFLLVPNLGVIHTLAALATAAAALGLVAIVAGGPTAQRRRTAGVAIAAATLLAAVMTPEDRIARLLTSTRGGGALISYAESAGGTVAVVEQTAGASSFRRLYIQGVSNSGDVFASLRYMRLQALLPLLVHRGEPRSALVIGLGTGITAGALLRYPGLERRVCAELLPAVVQAAPLFHGNYGVATDSRLDLRVRDGRRELLRSSERYDVITLEPPPPSAMGVVNLYSRDFYALAGHRLTASGLLAQWWPLATQNDEDSRAMVRAFLDAFPYASLWTTELHEMLLLGSPEPIELDAARIGARFDHPEVAAALGEVGIGSPAALLATWIADRGGLEHYASGVMPVTDDRPGIEYATWTRRGEFSRVLPALMALTDPPPVINASPELIQSIAAEQNRLRRLYEAALEAYAGRHERASWGLTQVLAEDPGNPYFASFSASR
jgi:spermidine synthase